MISTNRTTVSATGSGICFSRVRRIPCAMLQGSQARKAPPTIRQTQPLVLCHEVNPFDPSSATDGNANEKRSLLWDHPLALALIPTNVPTLSSESGFDHPCLAPVARTRRISRTSDRQAIDGQNLEAEAHDTVELKRGF